jgi:hypothetical protein
MMSLDSISYTKYRMRRVLVAPTLVEHRCGNVAAPRTWYWVMVLILGNFVLRSLWVSIVLHQQSIFTTTREDSRLLLYY